MSDLLRMAFPKFDRIRAIESWFSRAGFPITGLSRPGLHRAGDPWDTGMDLECFAVSHADVGTYVERGIAQLGIMEANKIRETGCRVWSPFTFPFGRYPVVFAAPKGQSLQRLTGRPVLRLATTYPELAREWFRENGIPVELVPVSDSPDTAVLLGLADAFVGDIDETHELVSHGFHVVDVLGYTQLKLVVNRACGDGRRTAIRKMIEAFKRVPIQAQKPVDIPFEEES